MSSDPGERFVHEVVRRDGLDASRVKAVASLDRTWLAFTETGALLALDLSLHLSIRVSPDASLAAIYETRGPRGVVVETATGAGVCRFSRVDYGHEIQVTPFAVAFVERSGRTLLVHATDWNRLDVTDPRTGERLTERVSPIYQHGERRPERYLDYYHGALCPSPGGRWLADDGWEWHPVGVLTSWSVDRWLADDGWESENGATRRALCVRAYFWGGPLCWIDDTTLAVWGQGDDDPLEPAVRLFDVRSGEELSWFPGPPTSRNPEHFWEPTRSFHDGWMVFDGSLFVCSTEHGVSAWDPATGARRFEDASFFPAAYQSATGTFLTLRPDGAFQLSRSVP